jgi:hypothetical protein
MADHVHGDRNAWRAQPAHRHVVDAHAPHVVVRSFVLSHVVDALARGITYPTEHRVKKASNFSFLDLAQDDRYSMAFAHLGTMHTRHDTRAYKK